MNNDNRQGWKECRLGDVGVVVTGKTPSINNPFDFGYDIPFVTPSDYKNYHKTVSCAERFLSFIGADKLKNKILPPKSVMVTCIGSDMGKVAINAIPVVTNQQINSIIPDIKKVHPDFLYYKLIESYDVLRSYGLAGTAVPIVNKTDFEGISVIIPPLPEQRAIAGVLSSLDDKIDLLHRQNKTLEGMAEALWRKMFVEEADPGWKKVKVSDIIEVRDGTHESPKQTEYGYHLITSRHLKKEGIDYSNAYKISEEDYRQINKRSKVDKHDLLFSMIGTLGLIHYVDEEPNFAIKNIGLFKSSQKPEFAKFLYLLLKSPFGDNFIFENADGSTQEYISLGNLRGLTFQYPGDKAINHFGKIILPYFEKIISNNIQIRTLSKLRDTLLPKLMSGETRVRA